MPNIAVSEFTGGRVGMGLMDVRVHATPEAAAKDIVERHARTLQTEARNKLYPESKLHTTSIEIHETGAPVGKGLSGHQIETVSSSTLRNVKSLVTKGIAGLALAGIAGVAAAMESNATPASVGTAMADTGIPGWAAARKGHACQAFGEGVGYVAFGLTVTAGVTTTAALTAGAAVTTGPGAVLVGAGGAALTVKGAESAADLGTRAGTAACEGVASVAAKVKSTLGFGA